MLRPARDPLTTLLCTAPARRIATVMCALLVLAAHATGWAGPASADPDPIQTSGGLVQGVQRGQLVKYLAIPFAGPTGGDARFLPPPPPAGWDGVHVADRSGPQCEQRGLGPATTGQSEECLTIDIYAPADSVGRRLPVIVWLYGGAFVLGSNAQYSADRWVTDNDVIIAIPNYRSGPFGFLALPELSAAQGSPVGNLGLLDQQAALRWVHDNIGAFGGDRDNVTLAGESAGAISVCAQLAAPAARGLFAKAIVESGICGHNTNAFASVAEAQRRAVQFAAEMGCEDPASRLACLRALPAETLLDSPSAGLSNMKLTWTPTRDGVVLPLQMPQAAIVAGAQPGVPILIGTNRNEGTTFVALTDFAHGHIPNPDSYTAFVREMFGRDADAVLAEYSVEESRSATTAQAAVITDGMFACPTLFAARDIAADGHGNQVWQYQFDAGMTGFENIKLGGGAHAAELPYLFSKTSGIPSLLVGAASLLSRQMQRQWSRFAYTGDPNSADVPPWPPLQQSAQFLELSLHGSSAEPVATFNSEHHCAFWERLPGVLG